MDIKLLPHINEEEVDKEFDRVQDEVGNPRPKNEPDPLKIERDYTGDLSGDVDDTDADETNEEIERQIDEGPSAPFKKPKP